MKKRNHIARDKHNQSTRKPDAAALRALSGTALQSAKGGEGGGSGNPPSAIDPLC